MDAAAQEFVPVLIVGNVEASKDEVSNAAAASKKKNYRPSLAAWMVAWDRYAMAAEILEQMKFKDSRVHRMNITEVKFACVHVWACFCESCLADCVRSD